MTRLLVELEIGFENLETAVIPSKNILSADVYGVKNFLRSFQVRDENDSTCIGIVNGLEAEKIFVVIRCVAGDSIRTTYGNELFDRIIRRADITSFTFKYSDRTEDLIYTDWQGTDETNLLQTVYFDGDANLIINIGKQNNLHAEKLRCATSIPAKE